MKKGILLVPVAGAVAAVVALGVMSGKSWSKDTTLGKKKINYCLLIGQTDHNDSQARTKGVREALHTRDPKYGDDSNPNTETPIKGELKFKVNDKEVAYEVNELESKTCIADSGATWDQSTAIKISNTWYSKYQDNLTMIVSNNDGMAEGALFSLFRPEGMPIFGYDSNASTVELIKNGKIKGTINSNAPAQAAVINIIARRIIDNVALKDDGQGHTITDIENDKTGIKIAWDNTNNKYTYDYTGEDETPLKSLKDNLFKGFYFGGESGEKYSARGDGSFVAKDKYICDFVTPKEGEEHAPITFKYDASNHSLLVSSNIVKQENITDFEKSIEKQADDENSNTVATKGKEGKDYSFFNCCYSKTDTYLKSTFLPLYDQFRDKFGIEKTSVAEGNGNDEKETLNAIPATKKAAYVINMTHTNNPGKYIEKIKDITGKDYVKTPIIFYNRQPTTEDGKVDPAYLNPETEANGGNPFVFYVGFDANAGAEAQGKMVTEWLETQVGGKLVD